jgi:hypothetical protein
MKNSPSRLGATLLSAAIAGLCGMSATTMAAGDDNAVLRQQERQRVNIYKAWFPDLATARKAAISFHANLLEAQYAQGFLVMELEGDEIAALQRFGFRFEPATEFLSRRDDFLRRLDAANAARKAADPAASDVGVQSIPGFACYETVEETFAAAQAFATSVPALATWLDAGDSWQKTAGSGGYDMRVLKLTNSAVAGPKPRLYITSAIHAREYVTAPLALEFARWLVNGYGTNPDATWIMDHHEVHLMLHTNPDGRKKAEAGLSWRKNTNTAYCGPNSNKRGADLNRNFTYGWNSTNGQGSSGLPCNETYRGPSPASEPEVQAAQNYAHSIWPDRRGPTLDDPAPADTSGLHIDLHSYSELVLWPWGSRVAPAPNGTALQTLGRRFAFFNNYTPMQSIGLYPTDGTSDGASDGDLGVPAYTFEMGTTFFQSCSSYNATIKPNNLAALIYAAKVVRAPYLTPAGPDVVSLALDSGSGVPPGTPVALTASVTDTRFNQSNGTEPTQPIVSAEAYVDVPPWGAGATPIPLAASDGAFNTSTEGVTATLATGALAPGRHLVFVRGTDASGQAGPVSAAFLDITGGPPAITLALTATHRFFNSYWVDLAWSGATGANVDIYRDGALVATTPNDGAYRESRTRGTWRYKVCQAGSTTACSAEQTITF